MAKNIEKILWNHRATNLLNKEARENIAKEILAYLTPKVERGNYGQLYKIAEALDKFKYKCYALTGDKELTREKFQKFVMGNAPCSYDIFISPTP